MLKRHKLALLVVLVGAGLLQADPLDRPISEMRIGLPSGVVSGSARLAGHEDQFLVVWRSEWRGGQASRVDATGTPIDVTPIGLPLEPGFVFFHDEHWVIGGPEGWVRLTEEGLLADSQPRAFEVPLTRLVEAVWSGSSLFAVVSGPGVSPVLTLHTFDGAMRLKSSRQFGAPSDRFAGLATDGDTAVVFRTIYPPSPQLTTVATLFDADGAFLREKQLFLDAWVLSTGSRGDGSGYAVVTFSQPQRMFTAPLRLHSLDHDLTWKFVADVGQASQAVAAPALPWDGAAFTLFAMEFGGAVRGARFRPDGSFLENAESASEMEGEVFHLAAASVPGATVLVQSTAARSWVPSSSFLEVRGGADVDELLSAEPIALDIGASEQRAPAAASGATQSLVVWRELTTPEEADHSLLATRVSRDGTVLDPQSLLITDSTCYGSSPAAAATSSGYLVAWYARNGVQLATVSADGQAGAARLVREETRCFARRPLILAATTNALLVWLVPGSGNAGGTVYGARVRHDGTVIDTVPLWLGVARGTVRGASNGTDFLVTWDNNYTRVTGGGTVLDLSGNTFLGFSTGVDAAWWNGTTWSVLYHDDEMLKITRIEPSGKKYGVAATSPRGQALGDSDDPPCDARGCWLVFAGEDAATGAAFLQALRAEDDGTTATIRRFDPVRVTSVRTQHESPSIAPVAVPGGRLFAAYMRRETSRPAAGALRIFLRSMEGGRMRSARR